ncbi:hypothetical protein [Streptomyces fructofermentans]
MNAAACDGMPGWDYVSACWQRPPDQPFVRAENLIAELGEPPD